MCFTVCSQHRGFWGPLGRPKHAEGGPTERQGGPREPKGRPRVAQGGPKRGQGGTCGRPRGPKGVRGGGFETPLGLERSRTCFFEFSSVHYWAIEKSLNKTKCFTLFSQPEGSMGEPWGGLGRPLGVPRGAKGTQGEPKGGPRRAQGGPRGAEGGALRPLWDSSVRERAFSSS